MYKLIFYLTIVNKTHVTVTLDWHDSRSFKQFSRLPVWMAGSDFFCRFESKRPLHLKIRYMLIMLNLFSPEDENIFCANKVDPDKLSI